MAYNLHDLRIEGIEVLTVEDCIVEGGLGGHSTLYLSAYIEDEKKPIYDKGEKQPIGVYFIQEGEEKTLFYGVMTQLSITHFSDVLKIDIQAKSYSYLMDIKKRSRSFQDLTMKYSLLVKKVFLGYPGAKSLIEIEDKEIGELIIQYEETDWAFLKRVLSQLEVTMTPAVDHKGIYVYVGIPPLQSYEIPYTLLQMEKDLDQYYYLKANGQKVNDVYYTKYKIQSTELRSVLDEIVISGQKFTLYAYSYWFSGSEMQGAYQLQKKQGLKQKRQYPMHLIGVALEGSIVEMEKDKVLIHLDIDPMFQKSKSYWFPYSTMSASPDGSGWYCMPEKGDVAKVYFPTKFTSQVVALSAVSNYRAKGGGADKMQDPNTKFLSTRHNKSVILAPDKIRIACNGSAAVLDITKEGKVNVSASVQLDLVATEDIEINAVNELTIHAEKSVTILCDKGGQAILDENGFVIFKGTEVKVN